MSRRGLLQELELLNSMQQQGIYFLEMSYFRVPAGLQLRQVLKRDFDLIKHGDQSFRRNFDLILSTKRDLLR